MQIRSASNTNEINWDDPLNKGLIAWYPMRQKGGNVLRDVTDYGNNGNFASINPTADWSINSETKSQSFQFSGTSPATQIDVPSSDSLNSACGTGQARTICFWAKTTLTTNKVIFEKGKNKHFVVQTLNSRVIFYTGQGSTGKCESGIIADGKWHFLCFTHHDGTNRAYTDGIFSDSNNETAPAANGHELQIGARDGLYPYEGGLSDTRIYNRALSESEVHDLYVASRTGYKDQFKRRYFPVSLQTEEPPTETATSGLIRLKSPKQSEPSYKAGYAKSASESAYPELWQDLAGAWIPQMGQSGDMLLDLSGHGNNGTFVSSPSWRMIGGKQSLFFDGVDDRVDIQNVEFGTEFTAIIAKDLSGGTSALRYMLAGQDGASIEWILWQYSGKSAFTHSGSEINTSIRTDYRVLAASHQPDNLNVIYQSAAASPGQITASASGTFEYTGASKGSLIIGGRTTDNNRNWEGDVYAVLFYNRALAFNELQTIRADPLAPFRQRRYAPVSLQTEAPSFNHWYAIPGRINRIVGSGVHV